MNTGARLAAMTVGDLFDALARRATVRHHAVRLADPDAGAGAARVPQEGYFQVRLTAMRLTDERRWLHEVVPAAFVIGEYIYNGTRVRKPCFVSNEQLGALVPGVDARTLRVNFANTLLIGPTPYAGGDVDLFVGLFQAVAEERLTAMFGMFEKLFGKFGGGAVAAGLALANELLPAVLKCLGSSDIKCLLADRRPIGEQALPASGYLAYLRGMPGKTIDTTGLRVHERELQRLVDGRWMPVEDTDFCLVQVQCAATRNDYTMLPFHEQWRKAQQLTAGGKYAAAQVEMLACAQQVMASNDLTESHKIALIRLYQAKLLAIRDALGAQPASRAGTVSPAAAMSQRVLAAGGFHGRQLADRMDGILQLSGQLDDSDFDDATLTQQVAQISEEATPDDTATLLRTLALGSMAS